MFPSISKISLHFQALELLVLKMGAMDVQEIADKLGIPLSQTQVIAETLEAEGLVAMAGNSLIASDAGVLYHGRVVSEDSVTPVKRDIVPHKLVRHPTANYDGWELTRTSMRPGAYDAFDKPSIINGVRKERV